MTSAPHSTRPAKRAEIYRGLPDDPPGLIDDDAETAIAVVKRQPVETGVRIDTMFARRGNLARAKQGQHAIGFDIQASRDDRGFHVERPIGDLDILRRRGPGLSNSTDRNMATLNQVSRERTRTADLRSVGDNAVAIRGLRPPFMDRDLTHRSDPSQDDGIRTKSWLSHCQRTLLRLIGGEVC